MYTIFLYPGNDVVLHDPKRGIFLTSPRLVMEDNCAGSLEFDVPPGHPKFDDIKRLKCVITVFRDGKEIWWGRPIEEHVSFYGVKHVYCEGLLSALHDTIQTPREFHDNSPRAFINYILSKHNGQVSPTYPWRPFFYVRTVTVDANLYRYTNYETTLEVINDKLLSRLGGHIKIERYPDDHYRFYLDYIQNYMSTAQQTIRFGQNLLDYAKNLDASDFATVIIPLGARIEGETILGALDKYLDVSDVNGGSIFVQNNALVEKYGKITKVVHFDDITVAANLLAKAQEYLNEMQYENIQLEIQAVDFHLADEGTEPINLLDEIRVVSEPHNLDMYFPVTRMEIPLDDPANMTLTLGTAVKSSLTTQTQSTSAIVQELDDIPSTSSILLQAKAQATELIKSGALGGHVVVLENELYITDNEDITAARRMWRWNLGGLAYSSDGGKNFGDAAITMDGRITANFITAGTMYADRIKGGILTMGGGNNANGVIRVLDSSGVEIGRWDSSGLSAEGKLSIKINETQTKYVKAEAGQIVVNDKTHLVTGATSSKETYYGFAVKQFGLYGRTDLSNKNGEIYILPQVNEDFVGNTYGENLGRHSAIVAVGRLTITTAIDAYRNHGFITINNHDTCIGMTDANGNIWTYFSVDTNGFEFRSGNATGSRGKLTLRKGSATANDAVMNIYGRYTQNGNNVANESSSSIRYKHNIKPLSGGRNPHKLYALPVKEFEWNEDHNLQYADMKGQVIPGIIAEDVEKIYPSAVIHDEKGQVESWDERRLIPGMLALIQEQHKRIKALERRFKS